MGDWRPHYVLTLGDQDLGELMVFDGDWPWDLCGFRPFETVLAYRAMFDAADDVANDQGDEAAETAIDRVDAMGFGLRRLSDGKATKDVLVRIRGKKAEIKIYPTADWN